MSDERDRCLWCGQIGHVSASCPRKKRWDRESPTGRRVSPGPLNLPLPVSVRVSSYQPNTAVDMDLSKLELRAAAYSGDPWDVFKPARDVA